jgi:uncharacterized membrane protein
MTGEFFFNDTLRPYSTVLFLIGIVVVAYYYAIHFPNRAANTVEEVSETDNQKRIEAHVVKEAA